MWEGNYRKKAKMDTERFKIEMLDYYNSSQGMVYRINIYNKKNNESWDIERSFKDFEQVDQLFQYRYPNIPKVSNNYFILLPISL